MSKTTIQPFHQLSQLQLSFDPSLLRRKISKCGRPLKARSITITCTITVRMTTIITHLLHLDTPLLPLTQLDRPSPFPSRPKPLIPLYVRLLEVQKSRWPGSS